MGIKLAVVGCGQFAEHFIALFKNHPLVDKLVLCDRNQPKLDAYVNKFGDIECTTSFQEVLDSDFDAVALFSQPWLHADMIVDVLDSKKHCWCTVPPAESIDDMQRIVDAVMRNKKFYYIGDNTAKDFFWPNKLGWTTICIADDGRNKHKQNFGLQNDYLPDIIVDNIYDILEFIEV